MLVVNWSRVQGASEFRSSIESNDGISVEVSLLKEILVGLVVGFVFIVVAEFVESGLELCDIVRLEANQHSTEISTMDTVMI